MASMPESDPGSILTGAAVRDHYADESNLAKRQSIFDFADPLQARGVPAISRIDWSSVESLLDVGCGNGMWLDQVRRSGVRHAVGLDLSSGMLHDARRRVRGGVPFVAGDVQALPVKDQSFDVALAFWMLFHVPDLRSTLQELSRILRPAGQLLAVTNSDIPRSYDPIFVEAIEATVGRSVVDWPPRSTFTAENASDLLGQVFTEVRRQDHVSVLLVPTAQPILDVFESVRGPVEAAIGEALDWHVLRATARELIDREIRDHGTFRVEMLTASFLCSL
jgi:SAM-dependent methyltransferase